MWLEHDEDVMQAADEDARRDAGRLDVQTVVAYHSGFEAGKISERERLAKAAEENADLWRSGCKIMDDAGNEDRHLHADQLEFAANWIRSQG